MANDLLSYPLNMNSSESRGNGDHRVTFVALKPRFNSSETAPEGMVALYLPPDALKTSYSQSYGDVELGVGHCLGLNSMDQLDPLKMVIRKSLQLMSLKIPRVLFPFSSSSKIKAIVH